MHSQFQYQHGKREKIAAFFVLNQFCTRGFLLTNVSYLQKYTCIRKTESPEYNYKENSLKVDIGFS